MSYGSSYEYGYFGSKNKGIKMTSLELVDHIGKEVFKQKIKNTIDNTVDTIDNFMDAVKIIRAPKIDSFEKELSYFLSNGYEIPPGESMKFIDGVYMILVVKSKSSIKEKTYL